MVIEEIVNDSLSRSALVYQSLGDNPVGPCRSGRIQDIDLMGMFNHPLFAWSGGNATVTAAICAATSSTSAPAGPGSTTAPPTAARRTTCTAPPRSCAA